MTSRQPGTAPPGTTPPETSDQAAAPGSKGTAPRPPYFEALLLRLVPLVLLIILGLAGLRGGMAAPRWDGPMHRDGLVIGVALEVVFVILLLITLGRNQSGSREPVAVKLRGILIAVLVTGMAAVAVVTLFGLHLHLFNGKRRPLPPQARISPTPLKTLSRGLQSSSAFHVPVQALLYGLLIVLLLVAVALSIWWARRLRPPVRPGVDAFIAEDSEDLREAVESGRSALRTFDDARAAIIACYVAMENSLAERGAARAIADTPDELLARARDSGLVRGTAAARLTALFYEARFSSHPLDRSQRDAAERALDELAAALAEAEAEAAKTEAAKTEAGQAEAGQAEAGQAEAGQAEAGQAEPAGTSLPGTPGTGA